MRKLRAAGYRQPIMGGDSYDNPELFEAAAADRRRCVLHDPRRLRPRAQHGGHAQVHQLVPLGLRPRPENAFAGLGFDAVNLVAHAILRAKSADPKAIRDALPETRGFHGVTGDLSYARRQPRPAQGGDGHRGREPGRGWPR